MTTFKETVQRENRERFEDYLHKRFGSKTPYVLTRKDLDQITNHTITRLIEDIERQLPEDIDTEHCEKCISLRDGYNTCLAKVREIINKYKQ